MCYIEQGGGVSILRKNEKDYEFEYFEILLYFSSSIEVVSLF